MVEKSLLTIRFSKECNEICTLKMSNTESVTQVSSNTLKSIV